MSNIYLKVTIEKKWVLKKFDFLSLKSSSPGLLGGAPTHTDIIEFSNFSLQPKNQMSGNTTVSGFSIVFILKGIMTF